MHMRLLGASGRQGVLARFLQQQGEEALPDKYVLVTLKDLALDHVVTIAGNINLNV